jgi:hypothetical protein
MNRHKGIKSSSLKLILVLGIAVTSLTSADVKKPFQESLDRLREQYRGISSIHMQATAHVWRTEEYGHPEKEGAGYSQFEYWASGDRYRVRTATDPQLGLAPDMDVAFDGELFQFYLHANSHLSIQAGDRPEFLTAVPNPFFLPFFHLERSSDECMPCPLRLSDLEDDSHWTRRMGAASAVARMVAGPEGEVVFEIPAGRQRLETEVSVFRVHLAGNAGRELPKRIERVDSSGKLVTSLDFGEFRQEGPVTVPLDIQLRSFDKSGREIMRTHYEIELLEINQSIDADAFVIDHSSIDHVFDVDSNSWIKGEPVMRGRDSN